MKGYFLKIAFIAFVFMLTNIFIIHSQTWVQHSGDLNAGSVMTLYSNSTNIYAGTFGEGVFFTTNNGTNWTNIKGNLPNSYIKALIIIDSNLYAGMGYYGVMRTSNNGALWSSQNAGLNNRFVQAFANFGNWLFAGTRKGGVFKTTNAGASWTSVNNGLPATVDIRSFIIRGTILFAGTDAGVYSSIDSGATWTPADSGLPSKDISALMQRGGSLYAAVFGSGVYKSTDGGRYWSSINSGLTNYSVSSLCSISSNIYAATLGGGVYITTNDGVAWSNLSSTIPNDYINVIISLGNDVFAGSLYGPVGGVMKTADNVDNWQVRNNGFTHYGKINDFVNSGANTFAAGEGGASFSTNNGTTWTSVSNGMPSNIIINSLVANGNGVLAGTDFRGVYITTNNGTAWTQINNGLHNNPKVRQIIVNSSNLYAASDTGFYTSTNNGGTWSSYNNGLTNKDLNALTFLDTALFVGTSNAVFKSLNRGASWQSSSTGLPSLPISSFAVIGATIFAAVDGGGVFVSNNFGQNWTGVNSGLGELSVRSLYVQGTALYAGTLNGLYVTVTNGDSWVPVPANALTNNNIQSIGFVNNNLMVGTIGGGVFQLDLTALLLTGNLQKSGYCTTNQLQVPVLAIGTYSSGNIFTAELSDTIGNFTNPVSIGTLSSITSGNINATIPPNTPRGSQYRMRVKSTSPVLIGQDNRKDISINPIPNVTLQPIDSVCASAPPFILTGGSPSGGSFTGLGVSLGKFDPGQVGPGLHTVTYTYTDPNGCNNSATRQISVLTVPTIVQDSLKAVCVYDQPVNLMTPGMTPTGGTFSGPGVINGLLYPATAGVGTIIIKYTVTGSNGCSNTAIRTIKVNPKPSVILSNFKDVCVDTQPFDLTGGFPEGGVYSGNGVISGKFYPALSGIGSINITYRFKDANSCEDSVTKSVHVYPAPQKPTITRGGDELAAGSAQTYQWYFKDVEITGATQQYYKPDKIGFYKVLITDAFGCNAMSDPFYFSGTDVMEILSFDFGAIYPNPSTGIFYVTLNDKSLKNINVKVKDLLGNLVKEADYLSESYLNEKIDISNSPSGIYFIEINTGTKRFAGKLIVSGIR